MYWLLTNERGMRRQDLGVGHVSTSQKGGERLGEAEIDAVSRGVSRKISKRI